MKQAVVDHEDFLTGDNSVSSVAPSVAIEPDSDAMRSQTLLKGRRIEADSWVIGRRGSRRYIGAGELDADYKISNPYPYTVSRQHCEIERLDGRVIVRDLGSRLGTVINGQRLSGRHSQYPSEFELSEGAHSLILGHRDGEVRFTLTVG